MPIIVQQNGLFGIAGTATLFAIRCRAFLVTAGHTIGEFPVDRWAYSESPIGGAIYTLGALHHHRPTDERYDVAVVELLDTETIGRLRANWRFLNLGQVSLPKENAEYFISG